MKCPKCGAGPMVKRLQHQIGTVWLSDPLPFYECRACGHDLYPKRPSVTPAPT